MSTCKYCGRQIDWVKTTRGKPMPVDPDYIEYNEAPLGTILVTDGGHVITVEQRRFPTIRGRVSHFATCPHAQEARHR